MALRGKSPETIQKRLKVLLYGPAGVGKTKASIQFPKPYLMDTEKGAENEEYVELLRNAGGAYFGTADFDDMAKEVLALLSESHDYQTLAVDPITVVYNDLLEKAGKKVGTDFGRHYAEADRAMKRLINLMLRLDMNVVVTCHAKNQYGDGMAVLGQTFDGYKKLDYLFDLVIELQRRGKDRVGVVRKTRVKGFAEGDIFPFSYDEIAARYGRETLERKAVAEVLATPEQCAELRRLCELTGVSPEVQQKWLDKALAESFAEMPASVVEQCIKWCKSRVEAAEVA